MLGNADLAKANRDVAAERADALRTVFEELAGLSMRKAAEVLNARGVATPTGRRWSGVLVLRVRRRLRL